MAFFNGWPWTQFQEQNLDWLIVKMKEYMAMTEGMELKIEDLKEYIDQFIESVDVQAHVNAYIDELVDQGYFYNMLSESMVSRYEIPNYLNGKLVYTRCFDATAGNIAQVNGGLMVPGYGYVCAVRSLDSSRTTLLIIDISTDTILQTYDVTSAFGHANSMAWTPDEPDKVYSVTGALPMAAIDLTNGTITIGTQTGYSAAFTGPDNKIYIIKSNGKIYDLAENQVLEVSYPDPIMQDALYYNGSLLILADKALYQYSYIDGSLIASMAIPDKISGRYIGEAENIFIENGIMGLGCYMRNTVAVNPTRSALRLFRIDFVNHTDYNDISKPSSVNLDDHDALWIAARDYRGEDVRFFLDPLVTYEFASFMEGRFSLRSQTSSQATVKGAYVRDSHLDSEYVDYDLDSNISYTGDIIALYSDIVIGRPQRDHNIQNTQSTFKTYKTGSYTFTFDNPKEPVINAPGSRTAHTPYANIGCEFAFSGSHTTGKLDLDLSAWFDDRPPVMFLTITLNNSDGYFAKTEPFNKIEMGGTGTKITIATPSGLFTNQYSADATGITTVSRTFISYDGNSTTPPGGVYPALSYVYHL